VVSGQWSVVSDEMIAARGRGLFYWPLATDH